MNKKFVLKKLFNFRILIIKILFIILKKYINLYTIILEIDYFLTFLYFKC